MSATIQSEWTKELCAFFPSAENPYRITLIGVGNPIKGDDSVGLYIISKLRKKYGANPKKFLRIEYGSSTETSLARLERRNSRKTKKTDIIVIFDAMESNSSPGSIIFANIGETKYSFFATHNVPLKLVPSVASSTANVFVVGVQAGNINVGEALSEVVRHSAELIIDEISKLIEAV